MSSQTTTTPASRPNLQERGRRAEQRDVNLHVLADLRKSTFRKHRVNRCKTTHPSACRKHGKNGLRTPSRGERPPENPTANQHPGVSQPHYPFTATPLSQPIRENLPTESRNRRKQKKADKRNRTADRCPEHIQISTDRKCGFPICARKRRQNKAAQPKID